MPWEDDPLPQSPEDRKAYAETCLAQTASRRVTRLARLLKITVDELLAATRKARK